MKDKLYLREEVQCKDEKLLQEFSGWQGGVRERNDVLGILLGLFPEN